jgi:hypothetical protein
MKIVEIVIETAAWKRKAGKNKNGGLNKKGVASYRREHPGSKLQTAVTTKPSKLKKGSKAAKRRKSFCARMGGMKGPMKKPNGKPTRKALALRKWHCESIEQLEQLLMIAESTLNPIDPTGPGAGEKLKQELAKELRRQRQTRVYQDQQLKRAMARHHEDDGEQDYETLDEIKQRLDAKCWKGKHKEGTKIKGGIRVNNCVANEGVEPKLNDFVNEYAPWVAEQLGIELPKIELLNEPVDTTFGQYDPESKSIRLVVGGRHPVDILRTLAHELTHHQQDLKNDLPPGAGETGTDQENEANANAGIMMRDFAKNNPEYFGVK